jgi:hypothetical protein
MTVAPDVAGLAALAICESLLLALNDGKILPELEIMGILKDAAASHENAATEGDNKVRHTAVADLINNIINSGNWVRHR